MIALHTASSPRECLSERKKNSITLRGPSVENILPVLYSTWKKFNSFYRLIKFSAFHLEEQFPLSHKKYILCQLCTGQQVLFVAAAQDVVVEKWQSHCDGVACLCGTRWCLQGFTGGWCMPFFSLTRLWTLSWNYTQHKDTDSYTKTRRDTNAYSDREG